MSKLLSNLPIEDLTIENDYLGIIEKGNIIKAFLESNTSNFGNIKMFTIFGEWGSGKSTLMKYLEKELKPTFNTFFFESWQYEKDENLSLSFLEYLLHKKSSSVSQKLSKDLLKYGGKLLRGLGKSVKVNIPLYPNGPSFEFQPASFVEEFSKEEMSFYKSLEKFKKEFVQFEDDITRKVKPDYNIIFIDDLDRCEPENVLNLLSAIKLFFTYGKKTIFFCGIDKKAIEEAVKTKYREVIKANEYIEKIFDISFSMPNYSDIFKLVNFYLVDKTAKTGSETVNLSKEISNFFVKIHFTNPRRVKKILNKYILLEELLENTTLSNTIQLPNIIVKDKGSLFETYLTLFLLIMHEFEPDNFEQIFDIETKRTNFTSSLPDNIFNANEYNSALNNLSAYLDESKIEKKFEDIRILMLKNDAELQYRRLIACFAPNKVDIVEGSLFNDKTVFIRNFKVRNKSYEYFFTLFMFDIETLFMEASLKSTFSLMDYKRMIVNLM